MKKTTLVKSVLAATMLFSVVLGNGAITNAAATAKPANTAKPTVTAKPTATPAPIMRDNLSKYGLKKDVELPVTVTAGGLSYTLEKIMIYDAKSKDAQALIKKFNYSGEGKYFIWTKITVKNNSGNTIKKDYTDVSEKWRLGFGSQLGAYPTMPQSKDTSVNDKEALWGWNLKPGQSMTSYQAYYYNGDFKSFVIWVENKNNLVSQYIVNPPEV
ncbi:hypothetical protein BSK66_27675 [Paenibacillus odorifer]|uniref:hypothetical protein n=1 Tax=Paenibacillus TaxID=44249 RepID=UPI0003E2AED4|nr:MULTISPECIES: hypothetical protein [Paenibacillus]ETT61297.1 hypothetical protein C171_12573 [Paenibacillus sp. FSL H8-237]OMD13737.1 hypothetical protein BJP47_24225 [Paenibacillus odorifer]OME48967.1 hypothetical protein BSK66_27675 [Paenibacillus odorifer]